MRLKVPHQKTKLYHERSRFGHAYGMLIWLYQEERRQGHGYPKSMQF